MATVKTSLDLCRNEFTTDDLAEAREYLDRTYGSRLLMMDSGRIKLDLSQDQKSAMTPADLISKFGAETDFIALQHG